MQELLPLATRIAALLMARRQSVAVSESSTGGLVSAALLAVPGASAYFQGGAVLYTQGAREALLGIGVEEMDGLRSASPGYAQLCARTVRERLNTDWGLAETGAAGPLGNRYGDAAGHSCLAVDGRVERVRVLETGDTDRAANMHAFARALLELFARALEEG